jgi:hypothetical protein
MSGQRPAALVATLGTRPQVVTIALDLLLQAGECIDTVTKRFSDIYAKLRAHIAVLETDEKVDRSTLIYYLSPYYSEQQV